MYLLHHINFQVTGVVHLTYIARDNFSNTQMSIISDIQLGFAAFQKFFLGGAFGQYDWPSWVNMASSRNFNICIGRISRPGWAWRLRIFWPGSTLVSRQVSRRWHILCWFRWRFMSAWLRHGCFKSRLISGDSLISRFILSNPLAGFSLTTAFKSKD